MGNWLAGVIAAVTAAGSPFVALADDVVAQTRSGRVTQSELAEFQQHRPPSRRGQRQAALSDLEQLVVWKALAERAVAEGLELELRHELGLERELLAASRLRRAIEAEAEPTDQQLMAYYEARHADFWRPRRWQLSHLFKKVSRDASAAERERVRRQASELRQRILDGEDFATLARLESDGDNRHRGGRAGMARLANVRPEVAAILEELAAGELSELVETPEGYLLLFCHRVLEAEQMPFAKAKGAIQKGLRRQALEARWSALDKQLLSRASPTYWVDVPADTGEAPWIRYTPEKGVEATITAAEIRAWQARRPRQEAAMPSRSALEQRLLLQLRAAEAGRRGLLSQPDQVASERWLKRRLLAEAVIERVVSDRLEPVTAAEVASFYAEHRASFVAPATVGGRAVRLRLDATVPRDIYQSFEDAAARAQRGELTLDQIPERVTEGPAVELLELTALTPRRLASMGAGLKAAVDALAPGEISDVVQEGDALFVFELLDRQAAQPLTQQEAERRVRQRLERSRRAQARRAFEREVLAAEELVALP